MRRNDSGFTLIEMMVVVVTIGILSAVIAPRFAAAKNQTSIAAAGEDLQGLARALTMYKASHGYWPADTPIGQLPPEIKAQFEDKNPFDQPTPINGIYDYENIRDSETIYIALKSTLATEAPSIVDAQALDEYIDDGVLNSGRFRSTVGGGYIYMFSDR